MAVFCMRRALVFAVIAVFFVAANRVPAASADTDSVVAATYNELSISPPSIDAISICHGFGCKFREELALTGADRAALAKLLAAGSASAAAERRAVGAAGAWFDRRIGPIAGTVGHVARATSVLGEQAKLLPDLHLVLWQWGTLAALPVIAALAAMITARLTVMRALARLP